MKLIYKILLVLFFTGMASKVQAEHVDPKLRLVIRPTTTMEDLSKMSSDLELLGYVLKIDSVSFNDEGEIESISGTIDFGEAGSGSFNTKKLQSKIVITKKRDSFGVRVNGWM